MKIKILWIAAFLFVAGTIYTVVPLFGTSYIPTHDGEYHIIRIVEFSRMLGAGYLFPRWAPDMNSGYGIPIFNYHYPLPDYIGSLVRVFTHDAVYAFQGSMAIGYIVLAIGVYLWLSAFFGIVPALIGSAVAMFVPYLFVDIYVRGTIGEVWATVFLILSLYLIEKKRFLWFAVSYGLLILSHNIMAMLFSPFILGYALIRNKRALVWMLGGIGLSAFFWLPALFESKYVVGLNTVNFREHFVQLYELLIPSWGTEFSGTGNLGNKISFQIGIVPILAIIGAAWAWRREQRVKVKNLFRYFMLVLAISVLLMFPFSIKIWEIITPLQLMQYPWRLLSFVVPVAGFCAAFWVSALKNKWWAIILPILAIVFAASYARPVLYTARSEAYYMSRPNFTDGTSSMGNSFSTVWTGWKDERAKFLVTLTGGRVTREATPKYLDRTWEVIMDGDGLMTPSVLYFPGWKASVDNKEVPIDYKKDGTIRFEVPAGAHSVRVYFTETPVRKIAEGVSVVSLALLILSGILAL